MRICQVMRNKNHIHTFFEIQHVAISLYFVNVKFILTFINKNIIATNVWLNFSVPLDAKCWPSAKSNSSRCSSRIQSSRLCTTLRQSWILYSITSTFFLLCTVFDSEFDSSSKNNLILYVGLFNTNGCIFPAKQKIR